MEQQPTISTNQPVKSGITSSSNNLSIGQQKEIQVIKKPSSDKRTIYTPTYVQTEFPARPIPNNNRLNKMQNSHSIQMWLVFL